MLISALDGGLIVEPSQDFVSLCHGWVLIGDAIRNRVVERNILSGETGATYSFNTVPVIDIPMYQYMYGKYSSIVIAPCYISVYA